MKRLRQNKAWDDFGKGFVIENPKRLELYRGKQRGGIGVFLAEAVEIMKENKYKRPESDQIRCWTCYDKLLVIPVFVQVKKIFRPYPILFCENPKCAQFMEPL